MNSQTIPAQKAENLLLAGKAPAGLHIAGKIKIPSHKIPPLPENLTVDTLDLAGNQFVKEIPANLHVGHLKLNRCANLKSIGPGLRARHVEMRDTPIGGLPDDVQIEFKLELNDCSQLVSLPPLQTTSLVLRGCKAFRTLPENLDVCFLDITECIQLRQFPHKAQIRFGRVIARDCVNLESLPEWLCELAALDIRNCVKIDRLPSNLRINGWLDIAGTAVSELPNCMKGVGLRWRGVPVNEQIVFHPETLTANDVIQERNAEVRRVVLERLGFERFLQLANARVMDTDRDKGGQRQLLNVELPGDEDLRCVSFLCPSTGRQYMIRVPPTITTCHAAIAWMAGFDDPNEYKPDVET